MESLCLRVKNEILALLKENPCIFDTPRGIALKIGRNEGDVEACLEDLRDIGICDVAEEAGERFFLCTTSAKLLCAMSRKKADISYESQVKIVEVLTRNIVDPERFEWKIMGDKGSVAP